MINVAGHRMGTAEIESALILYPQCSEAAAIGIPDDITGYVALLIVNVFKFAQQPYQ